MVRGREAAEGPKSATAAVAQVREAAEGLKRAIAAVAVAARALSVDRTGEEANALRVTEARGAGTLHHAARGAREVAVDRAVVEEGPPVAAEGAVVVADAGNQEIEKKGLRTEY